jgi:hypothetical protein
MKNKIFFIMVLLSAAFIAQAQEDVRKKLQDKREELLEHQTSALCDIRVKVLHGCGTCDKLLAEIEELKEADNNYGRIQQSPSTPSKSGGKRAVVINGSTDKNWDGEKTSPQPPATPNSNTAGTRASSGQPPARTANSSTVGIPQTGRRTSNVNNNTVATTPDATAAAAAAAAANRSAAAATAAANRVAAAAAAAEADRVIGGITAATHLAISGNEGATVTYTMELQEELWNMERDKEEENMPVNNNAGQTSRKNVRWNIDRGSSRAQSEESEITASSLTNFQHVSATTEITEHESNYVFLDIDKQVVYSSKYVYSKYNGAKEACKSAYFKKTDPTLYQVVAISGGKKVLMDGYYNGEVAIKVRNQLRIESRKKILIETVNKNAENLPNININDDVSINEDEYNKISAFLNSWENSGKGVEYEIVPRLRAITVPQKDQNIANSQSILPPDAKTTPSSTTQIGKLLPDKMVGQGIEKEPPKPIEVEKEKPAEVRDVAAGGTKNQNENAKE